jgi:4'-phosphopantetheinyl transferase
MSLGFAQHLQDSLVSQSRSLSLPAGQAHVWSVSLDAMPVELAGLPQLLPAHEWDLSRRFEQPAQARAFVLRRILLRQLLARYAGCQPLEIDYCQAERGKPKALGPAEGIGFNVSSAASRVLFAFVPKAEVGVDIEELRWRPGLEMVASRYFNPVEQAQLGAADEANRARQFFHLWTRKEAEAKLSGEGLASFDGGDQDQWPLNTQAFELPIGPGFAAHLALAESRFQIKLMHWSPDWLGAISL